MERQLVYTVTVCCALIQAQHEDHMMSLVESLNIPSNVAEKCKISICIWTTRFCVSSLLPLYSLLVPVQGISPSCALDFPGTDTALTTSDATASVMSNETPSLLLRTATPRPSLKYILCLEGL